MRSTTCGHCSNDKTPINNSLQIKNIVRHFDLPAFISLTYLKTILLVFGMSLAASIAMGQSPNEALTTYFDKDWKNIPGKNGAAYYRTVEKAKRGVIVRNYYISGTLQMVAECKSDDMPLVFHGKASWYYETGTLKREANFESNKEVGVSTLYYPSGKPRVETSTTKDKTTYVHCWTEDGQEQLVNGNAVIAGDAPAAFTEIRDFVAYASFQVRDNSDTTYTLCEEMPEPVDGMEGAYKKMSKIVKYPASARRMRIDGTVFIGFVVGKDGVPKDFTILKGIQRDCDDEALRAMQEILWKPGTHNGKPVEVKYVLPFRFKLAR